MDPVNEAATPAVAQAEQVEQVEQQRSAEATAEQSQEQAHETPEEKAKKEPWFQKRIGELTREKYEARQRADQATSEAQQMREQLARVQQGQQDDQDGYDDRNPADVKTLVQREAARLVAEQSFNDTCNKVFADGMAQFPNFDQVVANLQMVGISRDFLELATSSDVSAKLLHHLGTDLDEAARITALSPTRMAQELTRLEYKLGQAPAPKPVSKAPAPVKPIGSNGANDSGLRDDLPIDEWMRRNNAKR